MLGQGRLPVAPRHALPDLGGDGERLARKHRRLVRHADVLQIAIRVESRGTLGGDESHEPLPAPRSLDVLAYLPRLGHVAHHDVAPARMFRHLARCRLGLLVVRLAVDDRGEAVLRVRLDPLPHVQHRAAGRIHEHAAHGPEPLEVLYRDAEGGEEDDVAGRDRAEIEVAGLRPVEEFDPHALQLRVDVGVVDDLRQEEDSLVGELGARLVGVLHGAIHPVAEPELAGQLEGEVADGQGVPMFPDAVDDAAVVVGRERALDVVFEAEAPPEVGLLHEINLHDQGCIQHGTVSVPSGTASNAASTVTRPAAAISSPEPRARAEITVAAGVTVTTPLSSGTPCATSPMTKRAPTIAPRAVTLSVRCTTGQSPLVSEAR